MYYLTLQLLIIIIVIIMKIFLCASLLAAVAPPVKAVDHHHLPLPNLRGVASAALSDEDGPGTSAPLCKQTGMPCDKSVTSGTMSCCENLSCLQSSKFGRSGLGECGTDTTSRVVPSTCGVQKEQCSLNPTSLDQQCCSNLSCQPFVGSRGGSSGNYGMCTMPACRSENEFCSTSISAPSYLKCCGDLTCKPLGAGARGTHFGLDGRCKPSTPASTRLSSWGESEFVNNNNEDEEGWIEDDDFQEPTEDGAIKNE
mgnify:CR=1 FL=1